MVAPGLVIDQFRRSLAVEREGDVSALCENVVVVPLAVFPQLDLGTEADQFTPARLVDDGLMAVGGHEGVSGVFSIADRAEPFAAGGGGLSTFRERPEPLRQAALCAIRR